MLYKKEFPIIWQIIYMKGGGLYGIKETNNKGRGKGKSTN